MPLSLRCVLVSTALLSATMWGSEGSFAVSQSPLFLEAKLGDTVKITCSTTLKSPDGMYLRRIFSKEGQVLYVANNMRLTPAEDYKERVKVTGKLNNITLTFSALKEDDSGVYFCDYRHLNMETAQMEEFKCNGTLILVKVDVAPGEQCTQSKPLELTPTLMLITALSAASVFLLCVMAIIIWQFPKIKKFFAKRRSPRQRKSHEMVYEDMRQHK